MLPFLFLLFRVTCHRHRHDQVQCRLFSLLSVDQPSENLRADSQKVAMLKPRVSSAHSSPIAHSVLVSELMSMVSASVDVGTGAVVVPRLKWQLDTNAV
jgi:hypothetical protein